MNESKDLKTKQTIELLTSRFHLVEVKANGHIRTCGCDFWCTTEKYYNPKTNEKGVGLRNFIEMIERKKVL